MSKQVDCIDRSDQTSMEAYPTFGPALINSLTVMLAEREGKEALEQLERSLVHSSRRPASSRRIPTR